MKITMQFIKRILKETIKLVISLAILIGILPPVQAHTPNEPVIQHRIDDIRQRLLESEQISESKNKEQSIAQWYNWPNWSNWGNWGNWGNGWGNY